MLVVGAAGAAPAQPETLARSTVAFVTVPGAPGAGTAALVAPPTGQQQTPAFLFPEDGSAIRVGAGSGSVTAIPGLSASAQSIVQALAVSLFGGEIVAESVSLRATAAAGAVNATAEASQSSVTGLVVLGQAVTPSVGLSLPLGDWGVLDVLAVDVETAQEPVRQGTVTVSGLRVRLTAEHGGLPAGSEIVIGSVEASAGAPKPSGAAPPPVTPKPPNGPDPDRPVVVEPPPEPGRSDTSGAPDELVQPIPEGVAPRLSTAGYVFPVWGPASFGDSFGAYRGNVAGKWHHGEDIVATHGAPLLAVADGTLFSVGWNDIGGWRLWLRDNQGHQFYYAHLSAYSSLAVEGATVKAGDVIGFVGTTGDAEGGVPHLHFEIHPVSLLDLGYDGVIAPYPYLVAWRRAEDVSFDLGRAYLPGRTGAFGPPPPAAVLLLAEDISGSSGLVPGSLERAVVGQTP